MADHQTQPPTTADGPAASTLAANLQVFEPLPEDGGDLEADSDSAYANSLQSGSTSLQSSIIEGLIDNGRRYQNHRDNDINMPSDEKQFESMSAGHLAQTVIESLQDNPYFRSPISKNAQHILDLGTGSAEWAICVADRFPNNLYPPPQKWVPPNCILEVDDFTKPWTWSHKFDFVHLRLMNGICPTVEWEKLYKRAYHNLAPGGWIEHIDASAPLQCDDGSMPKDSHLANFHATMEPVVAQTGNCMHVTDLMREGIEKAGFINIHERVFKFPIGDWPKHPIYKEAGRLQMKSYKDGLEGWVMYALTRFGLPTPWTPEEVIVYVSKLRQELDRNYHVYQNMRRVWAQKPFDTPKTALKPIVENVESSA